MKKLNPKGELTVISGKVKYFFHLRSKQEKETHLKRKIDFS
jgi:hypothetical protein